MSYPLDGAAQNAALDSLLGSGHGSSMPSAFEVALFAGDPANGGVEMDAVGGYVRGSATNNSTQWPDAVDGVKTAGVAIGYPDATAAWTAASAQQPATHWLLIDAADSTTQYMSGPLDDPLVILGTETGISITPYFGWNTEGN